MNPSLIESKLAKLRSAEIEWSPPEEYDLGDATDRRILDGRLDNNDVLAVVDNFGLFADDLFVSTHPDKVGDVDTREEFMADVIGEGNIYGRWFFFPWSKKLVHFPPKEDLRLLHTARNRHLITAEEQRKLYAATLAIFGLSVGSNVVESLVISGIGGKFVLADPDTIEPTNLNRIDASFDEVGTSKIDHIAKKISATDPYIEQVHIRDRVTSEDLPDIVNATEPDILFDEVDDLSLKAALRLQAQRNKLPVIMATDTGDKPMVDVERHDIKATKPFNGKLSQESVLVLAEKSGDYVDIAKEALAKLIGIRNVTPRLLESYMEQGKSLAGMAQLGTTAKTGGDLAAIAARELLLGRRMASGRYIHDPKKILGLRSPTPLTVGAKTILEFRKALKHK